MYTDRQHTTVCISYDISSEDTIMDRESSAPAATGSRTVTQTGTPASDHERQDDRAGPSQPIVGVLKLRGDRPARRQKVGWTAGTIDNEGMGKKKSKSWSSGSA